MTSQRDSRGPLISGVGLYPIRTVRKTGSISSHVIIELKDSDGNVGWGELSDLDLYRTHMPSIEALRGALLHVVVGQNPLQINGLHRKLRSYMPFYWRESNAYPPFSVPGQFAAAVEMACIDLAGKRLGVPAHQLFGGKVRDEIPIVYPLFGLSSLGGVGQINDQIDAMVGEGVRRFRYYVSDLNQDVSIVNQIASRADIELAALDFGAKFRPKDVAAFIRKLDASVPLVEGVAFPGDHLGLAWARSQLSSDVSEHVSSTSQAMQMISAGAVDVFNLSVVSGGLLLAWSLAQVADAAGLKVIVGTTQELGLGTAAGLHFASVLPQLEHPCDPAGPLLYKEDILMNPLTTNDGMFAVPTAPGLGVEVDRESLTELSGELVEWQRSAHGEDYAPR